MDTEYDVPNFETVELADSYKVGNSNTNSANVVDGDIIDW